MKVKSESEVAQLCPTLSDPMDYSLPGSSVHRIFKARVLEWGAIAFSLAHGRHSINVNLEYAHSTGLPRWLSGKESACNAGGTRDTASIPGGGNSNPFQCSCPENSVGR